MTISNQTLELLQRIRFVEAKIAQFFPRKGRDDAGYNQTRDRLKKQFKNSSVVLRGGDILCIEGQNGSGKSRLLRELANEPAKYLNLSAANFKLPDFAVGYLPENPAVFHESLANNMHLIPRVCSRDNTSCQIAFSRKRLTGHPWHFRALPH